MSLVLGSYGAYISHLENLLQTDSQALKRTEVVGHTKKWTDTIYLVNTAFYLNILYLSRRISVTMQQEIHDPVKVICRIKELT